MTKTVARGEPFVAEVDSAKTIAILLSARPARHAIRDPRGADPAARLHT